MSITITGGISFSGGVDIVAPASVATAGWFGGGYQGYLSERSTVDRITYATDTATATVRGPLNGIIRGASASTDYTTYGWIAGGYDGSVMYSTIQRITYATDTATAGIRGPLSAATGYFGATSGVQ